MSCKTRSSAASACLVRATLPLSDPKTNEFVRRNGHFTLSILAPKDVGLPRGRYPRLVLAYLTTEAVRRRSSRLLEKLVYRLGQSKASTSAAL